MNVQKFSTLRANISGGIGLLAVTVETCAMLL